MAIIPLTNDAQVSVITIQDPAIDHDKSDKQLFEKLGVESLSYIKDRFKSPASWTQTVKFVDGQRPTVFVVGVIPPAELTRIEDECGVTSGGEGRRRELYWRCFLAGIREIENGPATDVFVGGHKTKGTPKKTIDGVEYVDSSWLGCTFVRGLRDVAIEIGMMAYVWNQLQDDDAKN